MTLEEYRRQFRDGDAPGWKAIDRRLEEFYPGVEPVHFVPPLHYAVGGNDPIDGISLYRWTTADGAWHYHYVTYGFSTLYYDEVSVGGEWSGYGFEMTFRLKPYHADGENPGWVVGLMQNLARYVFRTGNAFDDGHAVPANGPIRLETDTQIVGLVFTTDPLLGVIDTPHGKVKMLQAVGMTAAELQAMRDSELRPAELLAAQRAADPLLVTDLERK